ncbi:MAG: hypothetical protein AAF802_28425, partial [Planctomycetota bacterium]
LAVAKRASPESTLMVYYAGHGMLENGGGVFANFDIDTRRALETGWTHHSIADVISENFSGRRVLLFADCCYSGALENVVSRLSSKGLRAGCLTSASSSNLSTNNWTYTLTLIDLLKGQTLADTDHNGTIDFKEAGLEVARSMRFFEDQRSGYSVAGLHEDFILADADPKQFEGEIPEPLHRGQYVNVVGGRRSAVARIIDADPASRRLSVRYRDYSRFREAKIDPAFAKPIGKEIDSGRPITLPLEQAKEVASVEGKYSGLLKSFESPADFDGYGPFHDYGKWNGKQWGDESDLPPGYWVYVYPRWYIWENQSTGSEVQRRLSELNERRQVVSAKVQRLRQELEEATSLETSLSREISDLEAESDR